MGANDLKAQELRAFLRRRGPLAGGELKDLLKISQPSLSRLLKGMPDILVIGETKNRKYAHSRSNDNYPIVRVDESGDIRPLGKLHLLEPKGAAFVPIVGTNLKPQIYGDIPYFIWDLRPQGFLGKIFIAQNSDLEFPERWEDWKEQDLYRALNIRGDELVGNLVIGQESLTLVQTKKYEPLLEANRRQEYPKIADQTLEGFFVGSSAGGEQPKFTTVLKTATNIRHAIVKFSPPINTEAGRRWADLLFAEELALRILREQGVSAAPAEAIEAGNRVFLEVDRFDRIGTKGRRGILSLGAVDDELVGSRKDWTTTAIRLQEQKVLKANDVETIIFLDCFGALIANTDRHFGNLSLYWELGATSHTLAPVYDMLPMSYAPTQGNIVKREFKAPAPRFEQINIWKKALPLAVNYWNLLAADRRVSAEFSEIAANNAKLLVT